MKIIQLCLLIFWVQVHAKAIFANPWIKEFEILQTTPRKPAKTAILIISPSEKQLKDCSYTDVKGFTGSILTNYWLLGR